MTLVYVAFGNAGATNFFVCAIVPQISMLAIFFYISEKRQVNYRKATQINFKINFFVLLLVLAIGLVAMYGFSPLVDMFDSITASWGYKSTSTESALYSLINTFGGFILAILIVGILPSVCEELIFRGIVTNGLKKYGTVTTIILSAFLFALVHQSLQQFIYQFFLGGVMAYIILKTGSIIYTMLLHLFNNFVILLNAKIVGQTTNTTDYSVAWNIIYPILFALLSIAIIVGLLFFLNFVIKKQEKKHLEKLNIQPIFPTVEQNIDVKEQNIDKTTEKNDKMLGFSFKNFLLNCDKNDKFYKNSILIASLVTGILFWIFAVMSSF